MHYVYIYIYNILYIVRTPTCFDASASSSGGLIILLGKVIKIVKITNSIKSVDYSV